MKETALGLLIPETTDPPNGPAQIGGNAEKVDALMQKGGVSAHFFNTGTLTHGKPTEAGETAMGSYSTPVKVELKVVGTGRLVMIMFHCLGVKQVRKEGEGGEEHPGGYYALKVNGTVLGNEMIRGITAEGNETELEKWIPLLSYSGGIIVDKSGRQSGEPATKTRPYAQSINGNTNATTPERGAAPFFIVADEGTLTVEIQNKQVVGVSKMKQPYLSATVLA